MPVKMTGTSAGSYIMCPTIEMKEWGVLNPDRKRVENLTALNYVPFLIKAHYTEKIEHIVSEAIKTSKFPIRVLKDGEMLLIRDKENIELIS